MKKINHAVWGAVLTLCVGGCYEGEPPASGSGTASDGAGTDGSEADETEGSTGEDEFCVPGAIDCECLEGMCTASGICVDNKCQEAPQPGIDGDGFDVLAGVTIPLSGDGDGTSFRWEQVEGPAAGLERADQEEARAFIPAEAGPGTTLVFRFFAYRNQVELSADLEVRVIAPEFVDRMQSVEGLDLGAPIGFAAGEDGLWVATAQGVLQRIGNEGVSDSFDLGGPIGDVRAYENSIIVSNQTAQTIDVLDLDAGTFTPLIDGLTGGEALGTVERILPDDSGNLYITTAEGRVLFYDDGDEDGSVLPTTAAFLEASDLPGVPTSIVLLSGNLAELYGGDEDDRELYVGTDAGRVMKVTLVPEVDDEGNEIPSGTVEAFFDVPGGAAVTGLAFDPTGGLWVGTEGTVHIARKPLEGGPTLARSLDGPAQLSGFENMRFDEGTLAWTNSKTGKLGTLATGLDD